MYYCGNGSPILREKRGDERLVADIAVNMAIPLDFLFQLTPTPGGGAASPKKARRMSLSMPMTSKFSAARKRTASAPTSPAEPVTITKLTSSSLGH
jgi:hypothetical protein